MKYLTALVIALAFCLLFMLNTAVNYRNAIRRCEGQIARFSPSTVSSDCREFPASMYLGDVQLRFRTVEGREAFSYGALMWTPDQWGMFNRMQWDEYGRQRDVRPVSPDALSPEELLLIIEAVDGDTVFTVAE